tara:strand:- start:53 stop:313 length:261 start_codon:yes stop_codon:yes gene_type:complete
MKADYAKEAAAYLQGYVQRADHNPDLAAALWVEVLRSVGGEVQVAKGGLLSSLVGAADREITAQAEIVNRLCSCLNESCGACQGQI